MKRASLFVLATLHIAVSIFGEETQGTIADTQSKFGDLPSGDLVPNAQLAMSTPDYPVTAGDVYELAYAAGAVPVTYTILVDTSYKIRVSNLAVLDVSGKTYIELKKQVETVVSKNFPMSGVQFVLVNPAVFNVMVKGEVSATMERKAWPLSRLSTVVSTNLTPYSSIRDVTITSSSGKKRVYDLFKARRFGDLSQDPYLRPGDEVTISRVDRVVTLSGQFRKPGTYQLLKSDGIDELVNVYGEGFTDIADTTRIELIRKFDEESALGEQSRFDWNSRTGVQINNLDNISVPARQELLPVVYFEGLSVPKASVDTPGQSFSGMERLPYSFYPGEMLSSATKNLRPQFDQSSDLSSAYLVRDNERIPIDLSSFLYDVNYDNDLKLEQNDIIVVPHRQYAGYTFSDAQKAPENDALQAMTQSDYLVTPGDVYTLTITTVGGIQTASLVVNVDYTVNISALGIVDARGLTFEQFRKIVSDKAQKSYVLSTPQLIVSTVGTFPVKLRGEVKKATEYYAWGLTRLSKVVPTEATPYTSFRSVTIKSEDGTEKSYDLFLAERYGDVSQDPYLRPGDTIILSKIDRVITLSGEFRRPGTYQLLKEDSVDEAANRYGDGFTDLADLTRVSLLRQVDDNKTSVGSRYRFAWNDRQNIQLRNMDVLSVPTRQELLPVVFFEGAITQKKDDSGQTAATNAETPSGTVRVSYTFYPGEKLGNATRALRAQFGIESDLSSAYLLRKGEKIPINLNKYLYDADFSEDIELVANDTIIVPFRQYFVTVAGAVKSPGRYPYVPDRSWNYYVNLAGGIDEEKNAGQKLSISDMNDKTLPKDDYLPPESKVVVASNSFLYYFSRYAPIITTILSIISTSMTVYLYTTSL